VAGLSALRHRGRRDHGVAGAVCRRPRRRVDGRGGRGDEREGAAAPREQPESAAGGLVARRRTAWPAGRSSQPCAEGGTIERADPDFRALFESAPGLYLVLDPDFRVVAASDAYLEATLTKRPQILGRDIFDVLRESAAHPAAPGADDLRASLERVRRRRVADTMAVQNYDERGSVQRHWSARNLPVLDERKRLAYIIHRVEDVTERVRLEGANAKLRAAGTAKNEFLARMSHELRSPLGAIMGFGQLLDFSGLDEKRQRMVDMILKASERLLALVDEVVDLSRVEEGSISVSPEVVAVQPLVEEALELMGPLAEGSQITIAPPIHAAGAGYVLADQQRLKQVVINVLANGIKYNRPGGEVALRVEPTGGDRVRITIDDTGNGIDEQSLGKLFVPFERLDAAASGIEGTGLGLALSRTLIEAMGGTIGATSAVGVGSSFWIELHRAEPLAVEKPATDDDPLVAVRSYGAERRLLYIEDTVANVRVIEGVIERRPSIRLLPAMLGRLGLDLARRHRPDLILLDLHLSDLPGADVLAELQADDSTRGIPVVILSADAARAREPFLAAGARAYLTKPVDLRRLLEIFDRFLDDGGATPGDGEPAAASLPVDGT
jgi:PAS domain S-box-containing protein